MLALDLSTGDFDGQAVVALRGDSSLADIPAVASHLVAAVAARGPSVIVDLAGLESIGYSGLSVLLRVRKWSRQSGGDLPLAAPQQAVRQILVATGLIDVFSVYPSVEEAASSLRQAQAQVRSPAPRGRLVRGRARRCRPAGPGSPRRCVRVRPVRGAGGAPGRGSGSGGRSSP